MIGTQTDGAPPAAFAQHRRLGAVDDGRTLIGRDQAWTELNRAMAAAASGRGALLLVGGEAGVGKTRLASESLNCCALLTLRAATSPTSSTPYGPLVAILRDVLRTVRFAELTADLPMASFLAVLLPELGI